MVEVGVSPDTVVILNVIVPGLPTRYDFIFAEVTEKAVPVVKVCPNQVSAPPLA